MFLHMQLLYQLVNLRQFHFLLFVLYHHQNQKNRQNLVLLLHQFLQFHPEVLFLPFHLFVLLYQWHHYHLDLSVLFDLCHQFHLWLQYHPFDLFLLSRLFDLYHPYHPCHLYHQSDPLMQQMM